MDRVEEALERALSMIDSGKVDITESVAGLSQEEADRLLDLLETVHFVGKQALDLPRPVSKAANRASLIAMVNDARQEAEAGRWSAVGRALASKIWRPAVATATALALGGGVAVAAVSSQPTSPLYPVKRAIERVQTALPQSDYRAARLRLGLAETRLDEIGSVGGKDEGLRAGLKRNLDRQLGRARALAGRVAPAEREALLRRYRELERRRQSLLHQRADDETDGKSGDGRDDRSEVDDDDRSADRDDDRRRQSGSAPSAPATGEQDDDDSDAPALQPVPAPASDSDDAEDGDHDSDGGDTDDDDHEDD